MIKDWAPVEKSLNERNELTNYTRKCFYNHLRVKFGLINAIEIMTSIKVGKPYWERAFNILINLKEVI